MVQHRVSHQQIPLPPRPLLLPAVLQSLAVVLEALREVWAGKAWVFSWQQAALVVSEAWEKPSQASGFAVDLVRLLVGVMPAQGARAAWCW